MKIPYRNAQSPAEALAIVKKATPELLAKFQLKADIKDNGENEITAKGKGFTLKANFGESELSYSLDLSLLLRPLRSKIEGALERAIAKVL